jgi:hypothetical protein
MVVVGKPTLRLAPEVVVRTKDKIRVILNIAAEHGHDSLVLRSSFVLTTPHARAVMLTPQRLSPSLSLLHSAFGCGAFCNPPDHMAELFREVLEKEYQGCFKHICFAIFGTFGL